MIRLLRLLLVPKLKSLLFKKKQIKQLAKTLQKRGLKNSFIHDIFTEAGRHLYKKYGRNQRIFAKFSSTGDDKNKKSLLEDVLVFHREYHPRNITNRAI